MERLTTNKNECNREMICRFEDCDICEEYCPHMNEDNCSCLQAVLEKLGEYEDAEEQGLLLKLPCKVGTELFLSDYLNAHHRLKEYKFLGSDVAVVIECWEFQRTCTRMLSDFGKTIFLTKEEAEQAMKETKKCKYVKDNGLCGKNPACTSSGKCEEYCSYFEHALKQIGE